LGSPEVDVKNKKPIVAKKRDLPVNQVWSNLANFMKVDKSGEKFDATAPVLETREGKKLNAFE